MKEQLQHIFQNGYPGPNVFIDKVLKPIFSDDVITNIDIDIIDSPEKRRRADNANILSAIHIADIDRIDSDPIAFYDVTLSPGSNIAHSRVAIKQFIASEVMTFTHAFILFHYDNEPERPWRFSYVYKERTTAATRAVAKRYTYVFGKDYRSRTAVERFIALARSPKTDEDFAKAFSVETLSDEFFDRYRDLYADFVQYITGKRYVKESGKWVEKKIHDANPQLASSFEGDDKLVRDYIKKMFGRIVFLYFLQRKGWLAGNRQYMHNLFYSSALQDNFLDGVLEPLFFGVLNTRPEHRSPDVSSLPDSDKIPYLNGGLFQQDEIDERTCVLPADYFKRLFDFFDQYNFTIDENDPEDAEVGIDPEMLGRIFENLLEDNKDKGAFYTPKEIVEYMCRESIIAYLLNGIPDRSHELIRNFVETLDADSLNNEQRKYLAKKLVDVKICDPAIGSGAFPMGIVNILSKIYLALGLVRDRSKMKRHIMEQNIYGVDIEKGAVDIARLRFWLAMVVDAKEPEPLPNLHFKIMQGNSLLETYEGFDLTSLIKPAADKLDFVWSEAEAQMLQNRLDAYYGTTDHHDRDRIAREIHDSVMRQLLNAGISEEKLVGLDPSSTDKFFLWHTWFADVFKNGGFDIVIGNPPYIRRTALPASAKVIYEDIFDSAIGQYDIYLLFIEMAIKILKTKGCLCYIHPLRFFNADYGVGARHFICENSNILKLLDVSQIEVFKTAMTYPCILLLEKDTTHSENAKFIRPENLKSFSSISTEDFQSFPLSYIYDDATNRFLIGDKKLFEVIHRIESQSTPFATFFNVARGLANNKVSFTNGTYEAYKSNNVKRYRIDGDTRLVDTAHPESFADEMIIMPRTVRFLQATLKLKNIICLDRIYYLQPINSVDTPNLMNVLGVFNSRIINFWFEFNYWSAKVSGNYFDLNGMQITSIPFPSGEFDWDKFSKHVQLVLEDPSNLHEQEEIDDMLLQYYNVSDEDLNLIKSFMEFNGHEF